jgi:hypothetical protein
VNGSVLGGLDGTTLVNGVTSDVHDATKRSRADGNHDGVASVGGYGTADETFGTCSSLSASLIVSNTVTSLTVHGNTSHDALAQMLLLCISHVASRCPLLGASYRDLQNQLLAIVCGCQGVENGRELLGVEFDCN